MKKIKKKHDEYSLTVPVQLLLFQFLEESDKQTSDYSQTIELYDFMPKYVWNRRSEAEVSSTLPIVMREFECRGVKRLLAIHPAGLINPETRETKYFYPGAREQVLEEVLRKLAVDGEGKFLDNQAGIAFSIYQVRVELEKHHHTASHNQIRESLDILALTRLELISENNKKDKVIFSPIENLGISGEGDETQTFVIFSPFVTQSILQTSFRLYNYTQVMSYRSAISRQLHKRMAHHFTQASIHTKYSILLSTLIKDFGLTQQKRMQTNMKDVEKALTEMKTGIYLKRKDTKKEEIAAKNNGGAVVTGAMESSAIPVKKQKQSISKQSPVLLNFKVEEIFDGKKKNKIVDYMIHLTPSPTFAGETIKANQIEKNNKMRNAANGGASS